MAHYVDKIILDASIQPQKIVTWADPAVSLNSSTYTTVFEIVDTEVTVFMAAWTLNSNGVYIKVTSDSVVQFELNLADIADNFKFSHAHSSYQDWPIVEYGVKKWRYKPHNAIFASNFKIEMKSVSGTKSVEYGMTAYGEQVG